MSSRRRVHPEWGGSFVFSQKDGESLLVMCHRQEVTKPSLALAVCGVFLGKCSCCCVTLGFLLWDLGDRWSRTPGKDHYGQSKCLLDLCALCVHHVALWPGVRCLPSPESSFSGFSRGLCKAKSNTHSSVLQHGDFALIFDSMFFEMVCLFFRITLSKLSSALASLTLNSPGSLAGFWKAPSFSPF